MKTKTSKRLEGIIKDAISIIGISALSLPIFGQNLNQNLKKETAKVYVEPFKQPNKTTIYRGSGDVNSDGVVNQNDYIAMQAGSSVIQADMDIDGTPSTSNDLTILGQYLNEGKTRPADFDNLRTRAERDSLDKKTKLVHVINNMPIPDIWKNNRCAYLALQQKVNEEGYYGTPFPTNFDSTRNGNGNQPIFLVSILYPGNTPEDHGMVGKPLGDSLNGDQRIWENWSCRDPSSPDPGKAVKIGDANMLNIDGTKITIEKILDIDNRSYLAQNFIKFLINDGKATCTWYDTNYVKLERDPAVPVELMSFKANLEGILGGVGLEWETASESNNYGFEIERSKNGKDFEKIGFVKGAGTTAKEKEYKYLDRNLEAGNWFYRLKQVDFNGEYKYSDILKAIISAPEKFSLEQNYPNPFNGETTIKYSLDSPGKVDIDIFTIAGRKVRDLVEEYQNAGNYKIIWDGKNNSGKKVVSETYLYRLIKDGKFKKGKQMTLLK